MLSSQFHIATTWHCAVASFFLTTGQPIKGLVPISRRVYHQIAQLHSNCSINCFLCVSESKPTHLLERSRRRFGSQGARLSCKWGNAGMDRNKRRTGEQEIKRSCDISLSGCSVAQPVSLVTHRSHFRCRCQKGVWGVCVLLFLERWSQAQISKAEQEVGRWPRHMFIIEEMARFLSSQNGWLFPRSHADPSASFISHTLSLLLVLAPSSRPLWFVFALCLAFAEAFFLSLLRQSDPFASIWHCTHLNVSLSVILSLPHYQRSHLLFIRAHIGQVKGACLVVAAVDLDGDKRDASFKLWLLIDAWEMARLCVRWRAI